MTSDIVPQSDEFVSAKNLIDPILDGNTPAPMPVDGLGRYADLYSEMSIAHEKGGTQAAQIVFTKYAELDPDVTALRATDLAPRKTSWSADEILSAEFPEPKWAVRNLIPTGLIILAGRPKLGKSWLALQIAIAVASGGKVLGEDVDRGRVLYLALEDNARRMQDRMRIQKAPLGMELDIEFEWMPLSGFGSANLIERIDKDEYSLVIVDTLTRALGKVKQDDQTEVGLALGSLQRIAIDREISLLLIDHHRKGAGESGDVIDDIMSATSKAGVIDAALGLYRGRGQSGATLKLDGRDVDGREMAVDFDKELCCWNFIGDAGEAIRGNVQRAMVEAIQGYFEGSATVTDLAKYLMKDKSNLYREIQELLRKGVLEKAPKSGREQPYQISPLYTGGEY